MKKTLAGLCLLTAFLSANPEQGNVVAGTAAMVQAGAKELVVTAGERAVIDWKSFSIAQGEITRFVQPHAQAALLNRVVGSEISKLMGTLQANGKVYLINPQGVVIGKDALIDTAGFVASTLDLANEQFLLTNELLFSGDSMASVVNYGTIKAWDGDVVLLAREVINQGNIQADTAALGAGLEILLRPAGNSLLSIRPKISEEEIRVINSGKIEALKTELQADGQPYTWGMHHTGTIDALDLVGEGGRLVLKVGDGLLAIQGVIQSNAVEIDCGGGEVSEHAAIAAPHGKVDLDVHGWHFSNEGLIQAEEGSVDIHVQGPVFTNNGTIDVSGKQGGSISIDATKFISGGKILADSTLFSGGDIRIQTTDSYMETSSAHLSAKGGTQGVGGNITSLGSNKIRFFTSGTYDVTGQKGGEIRLLGGDLVLAGATLDASGQSGGGSISIGGGFQGKELDVPNAKKLYINHATQIRSDALEQGNGGRIIFWSESKTSFYGHVQASGGEKSGDGGFIEISSRDELVQSGYVSAMSERGKPGTVLFDPKNLTIDAAPLGIYAQYQFIDPREGLGLNFGNVILPLSTGNVAVGKNRDNLNGVDSGALYLYNGLTGALISTLVGGLAGDRVGNDLEDLNNGNFLGVALNWAPNALNPFAGAVTFINGVTGLSGVVTAANSLVGSTDSDDVGSQIFVLPNSNYVVTSLLWNDGVPFDNKGAVTLGSGVSGIVGVVSAANSLVGTTPGDLVGEDVTVLSNDNFVVESPAWNVGRGAVTWMNAAVAVVGAVTSANSLIGDAPGDQIGGGSLGFGSVGALEGNGNYVVCGRHWSGDIGAVIWGDGSTGVTGAVSTVTKITGDVAGDQAGSHGLTALTNGNYVIRSPIWNGSRGAATWASGTSATGGTVGTGVSIVGGMAGDQVSSQAVAALSNGHYAVASPQWDNGATVNVGAVTWGDGTTGTTATVSTLNSIYGQTASDRVGQGGLLALVGNGNYLIGSFFWTNPIGPAASAGAVTWASGAGPSAFIVDDTTSFVGSTAADNVGGPSTGGMRALSNGNGLMGAQTFHYPVATADAGVVLWIDGLTGLPAAGVVGPISPANALTGSFGSDRMGNIRDFPNGNYLAFSSTWTGPVGAALNTGIVVWVDGSVGLVGEVDLVVAPKIMGSAAGDQTSSSTRILTNGNYVVGSPGFSSNRGAVTFGDGSVGTNLTVSAANSLTGSTAGTTITGDRIQSCLVMSTGAYVVTGTQWNNTFAPPGKGSGTLCNGTTGCVNQVITPQNSLTGGSMSLGFGTYVEDTVNGTFIEAFPGDNISGLIRVGLFNPNQITYARGQAQPMTITPEFLTDVLNTGTSVAIQTSNDATIATPIVVNNPLGNGGALSISAGRSVLINADITTDNGSLTLIANDLLANGVVDTQRDAGAATLMIAPGVMIDAGTGDLTLDLRNGAGKTNSTSGDVFIGAGASLMGNTISVNAAVHNIVLDNTAAILGQHVLMIAGTDIQTLAAATIFASAPNSLIMVVDNLFPNPPDFGLGKLNIPGATLSTGGGKVWLFTAQQSQNILPAVINGAAYAPGIEFEPTATEQWGFYFPSGIGGFPFTLFYKNFFPPSGVLVAALQDFYRAISETSQTWDFPLYGGYLDLDSWPPDQTPKGLNIQLPCLVHFDPLRPVHLTYRPRK